jgi:hypothetical protein
LRSDPVTDEDDVLDRIVLLQNRIARIDSARLLCCSGTTAVDERLRDHLRRKREAVLGEIEQLRASLTDHAGGDHA